MHRLLTRLLIIGIAVAVNNVECSVSDNHFIGLGYNILLGNPDGGDLSEVGVDPGIKTTRHILRISPDTTSKLIVNDGGRACVTPNNATSIFYGAKSYQKYLLGDIVTFGEGDSSIKPFAFTGSTVFKDVEHRTSVNHNVIRDAISVCNGGRIRYVMPPLYSSLHDVSDEFANAVCNLPVNYDKDAYRQFLDIWGTHVIVGVETGTKNVTRYEQSDSQLADFLLSQDIKFGSVSVEDYMGYGSVVYLNISNFHHNDYHKMHGGQKDASLSIGTASSPQPVAYKLATIATFIHENFFNNASVFLNKGICNEGVTFYLPNRQNNTIMALAEYAAAKGIISEPRDPEMKLPITWPHGTYGLYKARTGCPITPSRFAEGWRRQDAEDDKNTNYWTSDIHLAGTMEKNKPVFYFCMKTANENSNYERNWPTGNYCILKKGGCPTGLTGGSVYWDDEDSSNANGHSGTLPDGEYDSNTRIDFCCRSDGFSKRKILLPIDRPFYLMRYTSTCQEVFGMSVKEEIFSVDTENLFNKDKCSGAHPYDPNCNRNHELHYCYYENKAPVPVTVGTIIG